MAYINKMIFMIFSDDARCHACVFVAAKDRNE